jgi:hypothetical protein
MNKFAIIAAHKPRRTDCIAIISGVLLGAVAAAGPAQSGDFAVPYQYTGYRYAPGYNGYYRNCYSCGCHRCGCYQCGCCNVARPYGLVAERHWVERDYWERRYPIGWRGYAGGYPYNYGGYPAGYPYYSGGYPAGHPYYSGASGWEPRPHLGFGGVQYRPSPISYEYDGPRPLYQYEAPPRPPIGAPYYNAGYMDEGAPRPPAGIPDGYYNAGYVE